MLTGYVPKLTAALIAVIVVGSSLCSTAGAASSVSEVITLKYISPESVMRGLGLISSDVKDISQIKAWSAEDKAQQPPKHIKQTALKGIDIVVPYTRDNVLIVYGERSAVDNLKSVITVIDVPQKKVEIKADIYQLDPKLAEEMGFDVNQALKIGSIDKDLVGKLKASLNESQATLINSPIFTTYQNVAAETSVSSEQMVSKLFILPRINGDSSITLYIEWSMEQRPADSGDKQAPPSSLQTIRTNRRIANGGSIILGGFAHDTKGTLLAVMSARILE